MLIQVATGAGRSVGIALSTLREPARAAGSVCLESASPRTATKGLQVWKYFIKETERLQFRLLLVIKKCLIPVVYGVCWSSVHHCECSVQVLGEVLKQNTETGSLKRIILKKCFSMDVQEVSGWGLSN